MKQNQNARKQRGRSAPRKGGKGSNSGPGNRSNEPKVRGNPKQLLEKYKNQAREAMQAGDRVQAEYFHQFADHYQRVLNEMTARNGGQNQQNQRDQNQRDQNQGNDDQQDDDFPQQEVEQAPRRARGRRRNGEDQTAPEQVSEAVGDPAVADQPVEVHPELDLDGTAAEEKPKRRRAPARRRSPKADVASDVATEAASEAGGSPEGNEAA